MTQTSQSPATIKRVTRKWKSPGIVLHFPLKEIEQCRCRYDIEGKTEEIRAGLLKSVKMRGIGMPLGIWVRHSNGRISPEVTGVTGYGLVSGLAAHEEEQKQKDPKETFKEA